MDTSHTHQGTLKREVSFAQLCFMGLIFMGPLAPVGIFGTLDAKANGAVAAVYIIAAIAMSFTAYSYMRMSREVPRAGSVFAYASAGIAPAAGYIAGWMILLDYVLVPSIALMFTGIALNSLFPTIPIWIIVVLSVLICTGLNLAGIQVASRVISFMVILEIIALVLTLAIGLVVILQSGAHRDFLEPLTGGTGTNFSMIMGAVSVAVLSFLGFDSLATFSEEAKGGPRTVGRATMACLALAGFLFIAQSYVAALISTATPAELTANPALQGSAFYSAVESSIGSWAHWMLALIKAVGMVFCAMVGQASGARIMMDMSREGQLPAFMAKISPKTNVPSAGILVAAVASIIVSVWAATQADGLDKLSSIVSMGALVGFFMLHLSVIGFYLVKKRSAEAFSIFKVGIIPALGALIILVIITEASPIAQIVALVWFIFGIIMMFAMRGKRPVNQS